MIRPDRVVALFILALSVSYGVLSWQYPLLPFEKQVPFRPNTMPLGLSVISVILSLSVLLYPGGESGLSEEAKGWREFDWLSASAIIGLMILYAGTLRPLGYILSTTLFLTCSSATLGERRFSILLPLSLLSSFITWYLVQEVLGVFLRPWPWDE